MLLHSPVSVKPSTRNALQTTTQGTGPLRGPLSRPLHPINSDWQVQQKSNPSPRQYTPILHNAEQRRAQKGGARGGNNGLRNSECFPPRTFRGKQFPDIPLLSTATECYIRTLKRNTFNH